jgi:hypothetical protein
MLTNPVNYETSCRSAYLHNDDNSCSQLTKANTYATSSVHMQATALYNRTPKWTFSRNCPVMKFHATLQSHTNSLASVTSMLPCFIDWRPESTATQFSTIHPVNESVYATCQLYSNTWLHYSYSYIHIHIHSHLSLTTLTLRLLK